MNVYIPNLIDIITLPLFKTDVKNMKIVTLFSVRNLYLKMYGVVGLIHMSKQVRARPMCNTVVN